MKISPVGSPSRTPNIWVIGSVCWKVHSDEAEKNVTKMKEREKKFFRFSTYTFTYIRGLGGWKW